MAKITIDGREYETENLADEAKKQLSMIQFVDRRIVELQAQIAVCQTARSAYGKALSEHLAAQQASEQQQ
ncbi:DUF6447 family protein [Desulfuromonas thiophila]|jgi:hypothetical protein|uniref:Uncharacterized protein n=1 Tax=Desulfuromonas thiophila TaxID=57664 RepID=A0A1G7EWN0_9BACT|nr:DUF6447 family protein [Desulfuromonas thiophila]SDE68100.1 hypothetical protein SAMN05661003_12413 [Desulfuromonas thiophila]